MAQGRMVSKKCRYALRAIFELSLRDRGQPVKIQEIATAQSIPARFLEVILSELKHGGFVDSKRGSDGGYMLTRDAYDLTVGEVIRFLEGGNGKVEQQRWQGVGALGDHVFGRLWDRVNGAISEVYDSNTFADLVEQELAHRARYVPNYAI